MISQLANNKTVGDLLILANRALTGESVNVSLDAIANVVDAINNAFDGCRMFLQYADAVVSCDAVLVSTHEKGNLMNQELVKQVSVAAYPNPFSDRLRFIIQSPKSGLATLELYNLLGQKTGVVFKGQVAAGVNQVVDYNVPAISQVNLMYVLRINGEQVSGKLFTIKK